MKRKKKKGARRRASKKPKKMTITKTRTKTRLTVRNPKAPPLQRAWDAHWRRYVRALKTGDPERIRKAKAAIHRFDAKHFGPAKHHNPRRPPKRWFDRCLASVTAQRHAKDPAAVCTAAWWKMPARKREAIVRRWERGTPRQRRVAVAVAKAERNRADGPPRRRKNPRELVSLVYREKKPGDDRPYEYEHEFEGKRPKLPMRGGKAQIEGGSYYTKRGWLHG